MGDVDRVDVTQPDAAESALPVSRAWDQPGEIGKEIDP